MVATKVGPMAAKMAVQLGHGDWADSTAGQMVETSAGGKAGTSAVVMARGAKV